MKNENKIDVIQNDDDFMLSVNGDTFFAVSLMQEKIIDEKEFKNYILNIEKLVRTSNEYKNLIKYLKNELNFNSCIYLNKLTTDDIKIELHHSPYTLFDIVKIMINKFEANDRPYNTFIIAHEVIKLHYMNLVGLVPLSKSMHELVHSSQLKIHKNFHIGLTDKFFELFKNYMDSELSDKYKSWLEYSEHNDTELDKTLDLFSDEKRKIYLNSVLDVNETMTDKIKMFEGSDDSNSYINLIEHEN